MGAKIRVRRGPRLLRAAAVGAFSFALGSQLAFAGDTSSKTAPHKSAKPIRRPPKGRSRSSTPPKRRSVSSSLPRKSAPSKAQASAAIRPDRVVVVFSAPETGGARRPLPIFERELAFEARLEALSDKDAPAGKAFLPRHIRAAMQRHIATELLAHLPLEKLRSYQPDPCDGRQVIGQKGDIQRRMALAQRVLENRVGGHQKLIAAARAEGLLAVDLARVVRREALAARYLDLMVTPMLSPSEVELQQVARNIPNPYRTQPYAKVRCGLRRWLLAQRLGQALRDFLKSSALRVNVRVLSP